VELDELVNYQIKYDFRLVVDIDDYWVLDPWHILHGNFPTQKIIDHIKVADLVTVTHQTLYYAVKPLNTKVEVLPNALPYGEDQFTDERIPIEAMDGKVKEGAVRIVYAGGVTHEKDIEILKNPMKRIASDSWLKERLHLIMCGFDESNPKSKEAWHKMISSYFCSFKIPGYVRAPLLPTQYMAFYMEADMTLAPLVPSMFNACRSNLKVLEAGVKKIPIVVSDVPPYNSCPYALKVKFQSDWYKYLIQLVKSPKMREDYGQRNYEWCVKKHNLHDWNVSRRQMYKNLMR
jgi:glycosyltransferase involved in cell wall biosynthesis